jgi:hypothetical protein
MFLRLLHDPIEIGHVILILLHHFIDLDGLIVHHIRLLLLGASSIEEVLEHVLEEFLPLPDDVGLKHSASGVTSHELEVLRIHEQE